MNYLYAFLVGGAICAFGQFVMDKKKIAPIYITCMLVVIGAFLEMFNLYDGLVNFSHMGGLIPISSFGHSVCHGVYEGLVEKGFLGLFQGAFTKVNVGITFATFIAFVFALIFKPKE